MGQILRVSKIHIKNHFLHSNAGLEMKSVFEKAANAEEIIKKTFINIILYSVVKFPTIYSGKALKVSI